MCFRRRISTWMLALIPLNIHGISFYVYIAFDFVIAACVLSPPAMWGLPKGRARD